MRGGDCMMQELVKQRTRELIEVMGTTQAFISEHIGCSRQTINYFLADSRTLALPLLQALDNFLTERGF